jgi:hypothetical protein
MTADAKTYLLRAALILKTNASPLILPAVLGALLYLPATSDESPPTFFVMSLMVLFVLLPLIYGQYIELINHNRLDSYFQVFRTHWLNYFVVSLILGLPILILSLLGHKFGLPFWGLTKALSIFIDILSIYIFPLVFLTRKHLASIPLGIKCLFGNLNFSLPLVIFAVIPSLFNLFGSEISDTTVLSWSMFALNYLFWIVSLLIDFVVFVAAALVLKEKLYRS